MFCDAQVAKMKLSNIEEFFTWFQKAAEKAEGELKPVQEVPVKQSEKDPKTDSGCVLS